MSRALLILFVIYFILTLIGCLDEFSTIPDRQSTLLAPEIGTPPTGMHSEATMTERGLDVHSGVIHERSSN